MKKKTILKLSQNPYYIMNEKELDALDKYEDVELITQEIREDDINIEAPKIRREDNVKRIDTATILRDKVSEKNLVTEVQQVPDLQQPDSKS